MDMKKRHKIPKKQLEKENRRARITLDGRFGQKWRIEKEKDKEIYNLHIYGKYGNERQYFWSMGELNGIIKGIFLAQFLADKFRKDGKII